MVAVVRVCECGAHLVCNVFTCLPFVNTHRLNGCCCCCYCCLMHVQNLCGCWMKELKREMHSREPKSTYASTTANTTFSLLLPPPPLPSSSSSLLFQLLLHYALYISSLQCSSLRSKTTNKVFKHRKPFSFLFVYLLLFDIR